MGYWSKQTHGV